MTERTLVFKIRIHDYLASHRSHGDRPAFSPHLGEELRSAFDVGTLRYH